MPLRDHFRSPLDDIRSWEGFHGAWPTLIVAALNSKLPQHYIAEPRVHLGAAFEIDVAASEDDAAMSGTGGAASEGGVATATWAPPRPTLNVATDVPEQDEYAVLVFDMRRHRRLVAAIEIVSPANKDRPEHRRAFVAKCAALLQQGVSVAIVDLVTTRQSNLYADLLTLIGLADPSLGEEPGALYASACRWRRDATTTPASWRLEAWSHTLAVKQPLPTLPLWLAEDLAVPLELEPTYEETCRVLRIP